MENHGRRAARAEIDGAGGEEEGRALQDGRGGVLGRRIGGNRSRHGGRWGEMRMVAAAQTLAAMAGQRQRLDVETLDAGVEVETR